MSHSVDTHVGARLRFLRRLAGLSQEALANRLGVTFQQIQKYERGANRLSASRLYDAAMVFGVKVDAFYEGLPDTSNGAKEDPFAARIATDFDLRKLLMLYESQATPERRERFVSAFELIARAN